MKLDPDGLPPPKTPYRGILPFRLLDWPIFLERDAETERLASLVSLYRGVLLYGQSGAGKSSLLNAGLIPDALRRGRAPERIRVFPEAGRELVVERLPLHEENGQEAPNQMRYLPSRFTAAQTDERVALASDAFLEKLRTPSDLGVPLLIFDQFEELVTLFEENPKERDKFEKARKARLAIENMLCELLLEEAAPLKIVFAFRDDYLARLTPLFSRIPNLMDQGVRLAAPHIEVVQSIVRGPFVRSEDGRRGLPGHFRDALSDDLAAKIEAGIRERRPSGIVNLSELQTLCLALWREPPRQEELLREDAPGTVLEKIIEAEAAAALKALARMDRVRALAILSNLVTLEGTRDVVSAENLIEETRRMPVLRVLRGDLKKLLDTLVAKTGLLRRSLSSGNTYYELQSEFLISWIQKQQQKFRKIAAGFVFGGLLCVAIIMAGFALAFNAQRIEAEKARQQAEEAKNAAEELINFMQYDLRDTLGTIGRLDMMSAINARIRKYHEDHPSATSDLGALRERSVASDQQGDILFDQGDLAGALKSYQDGLAIADRLAKQDPGNAGWQRDLSVSYDRIGDVQRAQGDLAGALKSYQDGLAIRDQLAKQDPGNAGWQRDLSVSYNKVGDVRRAQGDLAGALKSYQDGLGIRDQFAKLDPGNAGWQRDLSVSYDRVGDVQRAQGDLAGALKSYQDGLAIADRLAKQDPGNAGWQGDLAFSYWRTGTTLGQVEPKSKNEAREMVQKARDILQQMQSRIRLTAQQQQWLDAIDADLTGMR
jgi:tetratricopeptide (TPR) repeat protein